MKIFDNYDEAREALLYRAGGFNGSFLWRTKGGFVKAATFTLPGVFFFVPAPYRVEVAQ